MSTVSMSCKVEVDRTGREEWSRALAGFHDANLYQTWSYGAVRWGEGSLSRLILREGDEIVAAAQARIVRMPILGAGIANIKWGPLWQRSGRSRECDVLRLVLQALHEEYVEKRGLLLRISPNHADGGFEDARNVLLGAKFAVRGSAVPYNTILLDLSPGLDEIRRGLKKKWRQYLNRAEHSSLTVREGTGDDLFAIAVSLHGEMLRRKGFKSFLAIDDLAKVQRDLEEDLKMRIAVCELDGIPVAARVVSAIGRTAIDMVAATGDRWLDMKGSYLAVWKIIERLKSEGCEAFDLGGIDAEKNPGGYQFKAGLAGKNGREVCFEEFEASRSIMSTSVVRIGDQLRACYRRKGHVFRRPGTLGRDRL